MAPVACFLGTKSGIIASEIGFGAICRSPRVSLLPLRTLVYDNGFGRAASSWYSWGMNTRDAVESLIKGALYSETYRDALFSEIEEKVREAAPEFSHVIGVDIEVGDMGQVYPLFRGAVINGQRVDVEEMTYETVRKVEDAVSSMLAHEPLAVMAFERWRYHSTDYILAEDY